MKCFVLLSLVALACAGPLNSGIWQNYWLHNQLSGQWSPIHQQWPYGYHQGIYGHPLLQKYLSGPATAHEQVIQEHPVGQIGDHHIVEQIVAQDQQAALHSTLGHQYGAQHPYGVGYPYGSEHPYGVGYPYGSEHPYGVGYPYGAEHPYGLHGFYGSYLHKQFPYGSLALAKGFSGYHNPLNTLAGQGIGEHIYPWGWHHLIY